MPRPAKAAKLSLLDGNKGKKNTQLLKKRAEQEQKMKLNTDKLLPPNWLDKDGKEAFLFVVDELKKIEIIGNADLHSVALYADFYSQYLKYRRIVKAKGNWIEGRPNPFILKMENAAKQMRSFASDIGLSPQARTRLALKLAEGEGEPEWN